MGKIICTNVATLRVDRNQKKNQFLGACAISVHCIQILWTSPGFKNQS